MRTRFRLPSVDLAALDNGLPTASPTVLLVPGYTGSKEDFLPLLRPLGRAGYRAISVDQRGQYESGWANSPEEYTIDALATDVCQLAADLGQQTSAVHLVGHSFGGLVARAAVLRKPELFADLVLMGSGPAAIGGPRRDALDAGEQILAEHGMATLWEQLQLRSQADPRYVRPAPALLEFLRTRFMATDPVGLAVMGRELRSETDQTEDLAGLNKPILVLHGVDDDAWPPEVQAEMAARLGVPRVAIEEAAHSPAVENPDATVAALVEFWQSIQA